MRVNHTIVKRPLKLPKLPSVRKLPSLPKLPSVPKLPSMSKGALKPFREFFQETLRGTRGRASPNKVTEGTEAYDTDITDAASVIIGSELSVSARKALSEVTEGTEAYDTDITDAASVIIGSELSVSARKALSDSFVNDLEKMCEGGRLIMAIMVAMD